MHSWAVNEKLVLAAACAVEKRNPAERPSTPSASAIIGFARDIQRRVFRALPASPQAGARGY
jgi:hypothetical protein